MTSLLILASIINCLLFSMDGPALLWNTKFTQRNQVTYAAENKHCLIDTANNKTEFMKRLFGLSTTTKLALPGELSYPALRRFLSQADMNVLARSAPAVPNKELVLLDERKDTVEGITSTRVWDSAGDPGYLRYATPGDVKKTGAVSVEDLFKVLSGLVGVIHHDEHKFRINSNGLLPASVAWCREANHVNEFLYSSNPAY
jgi:hypothetical protein